MRMMSAGMAGALALGGAGMAQDGGIQLSGSTRATYESLSGQFRPGRGPNDQLLTLRTIVKLEAGRERVRGVFELIDSRAWLADSDTPISTGEVNVLEPVQAHLVFDTGGVLGARSSSLLVGRFTQDLGSRRLVGRNNFRNTTNAYTGARFVWNGKGGDRLTALWTFPQLRQPSDRDSLLDNAFAFDAERADFNFSGLYYERPSVIEGVNADVFVFRLFEGEDVPGARHRRLWTPGLRLRRPPAAGTWDFELEGGWQLGSVRASTDPVDTRDLDVSAQYLHAELGYTFDAPWRPRLKAEYEYASGDGDPQSGTFTRFDPMFGPRRFDFGPTGIYGALSRVNISSPGLRLEAVPNDRWDGFVSYRGVWLADAADRFDRGGSIDPSGQSGSFVGQQIEFRARYWLVPGTVRLEAGGAALIQGEFLKSAPNAPGHGDTRYGYVSMSYEF
ncbi:alginate export family protein [Glycocaulis profundi]|nr:alginate export family protein [Glycocaulis profundi]